ncbi:MAG: TIR domain-containing protein, partial [Thiobacillaceae bacterium]
FDEIYRKRSRYCVIFVSKDYKERMWTNHERQSAQARAVTERGREYILPVRVDGTELDGMPPTIGYVPVSKGIDTIGQLLVKKLES